jgi:hypothetical protein
LDKSVQVFAGIRNHAVNQRITSSTTGYRERIWFNNSRRLDRTDAGGTVHISYDHTVCLYIESNAFVTTMVIKDDGISG